MLSKCIYLLLALICLQTISGRYVHRRDVSKSSSDESDESKAGLSLDAITNSSSFDVSKDLTDADITKMKNDVSKELTPFQLEEFGRILLKFKKGTTTRDRLGGMVELLVFVVAVKSNATDVDIKNIFENDAQTTTIVPITNNNI